MASNNIEIEAKVLLSKRDYLKLLENMSFGEQVKIQNNYYLDSKDRVLKKYGMTVIDPAVGMLACRDVGAGKMPSEELLMEYILKYGKKKADLHILNR